MFLELIVAALATAGASAPVPPVAPPVGELPNGGRACLILDRCDPRPCIIPAQGRRAPLPPPRRCRGRRARPEPRVVPAATR